jgi:hypothetical protein
MCDHASIKPRALSDDLNSENLDWEEEENLTDINGKVDLTFDPASEVDDDFTAKDVVTIEVGGR